MGKTLIFHLTFGLAIAKLQECSTTIPYVYKLEFVTADHPKRGVAFLVSRDERVTAWPFFNGLKNDKLFRYAFDNWIARNPKPKLYHGWHQSAFSGKYTNCFVFKHKGMKEHDHLYGFLCHPKQHLNPAYELCVLVMHEKKNYWETKESNLRAVEAIRIVSSVQTAVYDYFKGKKP